MEGAISLQQNEASKHGSDRNQIAQKQQSVASWRSLTVLHLGNQGLLPQDIVRETGIPRSTVYRYYWKWFGKRQAQIARRKQAAELLAQMWERDRAGLEYI